MKSRIPKCLRLFFITFHIIFLPYLVLEFSFASDLITIQTPSTGYQPQFQVLEIGSIMYGMNMMVLSAKFLLLR